MKNYSERYAKIIASKINCSIEPFVDFDDNILTDRTGKTIYQFCNKTGKSIGLSDVAAWCYKYNIKVDEESNQIGFNEDSQKWVGWSHRGAQSFGIGDMLYSEEAHHKLYEQDESLAEITPFIKIGFKKIETLEEARQAAYNFALSIS